MSDSADELAIRLMLDDQQATEQRIASARHLENSATGASFTALLDLSRSPEEDDALLQAAARSLAKVADAMNRQGDVTDLNPVAHAAYNGE